MAQQNTAIKNSVLIFTTISYFPTHICTLCRIFIKKINKMDVEERLHTHYSFSGTTSVSGMSGLVYILNTTDNIEISNYLTNDLLITYAFIHSCILTRRIQKISTICAYLSCIAETAYLHMHSDFLYPLASHRHHFVGVVLCLLFFLCVKHI